MPAMALLTGADVFYILDVSCPEGLNSVRFHGRNGYRVFAALYREQPEGTHCSSTAFRSRGREYAYEGRCYAVERSIYASIWTRKMQLGLPFTPV